MIQDDKLEIAPTEKMSMIFRVLTLKKSLVITVLPQLARKPRKRWIAGSVRIFAAKICESFQNQKPDLEQNAKIE